MECPGCGVTCVRIYTRKVAGMLVEMCYNCLVHQYSKHLEKARGPAA